jgi:two-component system sensor histidine kinase/response regulator
MNSAPVLDVDEGVMRVGGLEELFDELLTRFVEEYPGGRLELDALPPSERVRRVHSIKGVAGSLGARRLFEVARQFEDQLRSAPSAEAAPELKAAFVEALSATFHAMQGWLASRQQARGSVASGDVDGAALLGRLRGLLASGDPEALELVTGHRELLRERLGPSFGPFEEAVQGFDFGAAEALLPV